MPQQRTPNILKMVSPTRNSIEDLAQIVSSEELSDALRLYNEVKREAARAALMVQPSTSTEDQLAEVGEEAEVEDKQQTVCMYNFSCSLCNEIFENQEDLTSHNCLHDPNVNVMYECQECRTLFQSLDALAQHMKIHEENVLVIRSSRVTKHSTKDKVGYVCSICDKVLSSKGSVIKHQELHKGLRPYDCSYCGKTFSIKGNRNKHEQIHAGEKPYKCHICEKSFSLKGNLKKHLLTHTNYKEYKCELCQKDFTLKGNLDKHMKRHENGLNKRPVVISEVCLDEEAEMEEMETITEETEIGEEVVVAPPAFKINVKIIESSGSKPSESVKEIKESIECIPHAGSPEKEK